MISNSKLNNVYGIPSPLGIILGGLLAFCVWFSIFNDSSIERMIFILMLIIGVVHILEASYAFRMLEAQCYLDDPQFLDEEVLLCFEMKNNSKEETHDLFVKLKRKDRYNKIETIPKNYSKSIKLKYRFKEIGKNPIPELRIKSYSGLHIFWRSINTNKEVFVLPKPIDHGVNCKKSRNSSEDHELNHLEEILEPSRFKFADPKLFQKTNKRYQRVYHSKGVYEVLSFSWDELKHLPKKEKGEQFSFWLKSLEKIKKNEECKQIIIKAPFLYEQINSSIELLNLKELKLKFIKYYEKI